MKVVICSYNEDTKYKLYNDLKKTFAEIILCHKNNTLNNILSKLKGNEAYIILYHLKNGIEEEKYLYNFLQTTSIAQNLFVLCNTPSTDQGIRLLHAGIHGYANTHIDNEKLITAIQVINQGEIWAGEDILRKLLSIKLSSQNEQNDRRKSSQEFVPAYLKPETDLDIEIDDDSSDKVFTPKQSLRSTDNLTKREYQVFHEVLKGKTNKEIANDIFITERTVKAHLSSIYKKTNTRNRFELSVKYHSY